MRQKRSKNQMKKHSVPGSRATLMSTEVQSALVFLQLNRYSLSSQGHLQARTHGLKSYGHPGAIANPDEPYTGSQQCSTSDVHLGQTLQRRVSSLVGPTYLLVCQVLSVKIPWWLNERTRLRNGMGNASKAQERLILQDRGRKTKESCQTGGLLLLSAKLMLNINGSLSFCLYLAVKQINSSANSLFICRHSHTFIQNPQ